MKYLSFIILILFIITINYILNKKIKTFYNKDIFSNIKQNVDFYVVTMKSEDRLENIEKQTELLKKSDIDTNLIYVDAVVGKDINIDELIQNNILTENIYENKDSKFTEIFEKRKNEVGCYLSHLKIYDMIKEKGNTGYSIIFEDDFELLDNFSKILHDSLLLLDDRDFDMLFLGIYGNNGDHVIGNIYNVTPTSWCTHGYLVNNKNIDKIIDKLKYIETIVDVSIFTKANNNELIVYRLEKEIVTQFNFESSIR